MRKLFGFLLLSVFLFGAVDINTADVNELAKLKGVGMKKATDIVQYRQKQCFKSVDELQNVKGIGQKTIEKNRSELSASECK